MLSSLPCFYDFCWSALHAWCMLELKFAIYYKAASLHSQASYAVLAEESQAFFKHSELPAHPVFLIQQTYVKWLHFVAKWFVRMRTREKNGVIMEAIVLQWAVQIAWRDFKLRKKRWAGHCPVKNAAVLCENHRERVAQIWTSPFEEEEEEEEEEEKEVKPFGRLGTFWFGTFAMLFSATGCFSSWKHSKMNSRVL